MKNEVDDLNPWKLEVTKAKLKSEFPSVPELLITRTLCRQDIRGNSRKARRQLQQSRELSTLVVGVMGGTDGKDRWFLGVCTIIVTSIDCLVILLIAC